MLQFRVIKSRCKNSNGDYADPIVEDVKDIKLIGGVKHVAEWITNNTYYLEPSCAPTFSSGFWVIDQDSDYKTGDIIETTYHFKNFSVENQRKLYDLLFKKAAV